jgi:hypothetical protein
VSRYSSTVLWLQAFVLTQIFEVPIYLFAIRERPVWQRLLIAFGASAVTHPVVWYVVVEFGHLGYWPIVACAEVFAVLAEAGWLWAFRVRRPLLWALTANATSFGLGLLLHWLGVWG